MIPIEKNIRVVDDQNNQYEQTYLKRAKGLVKKGRAYFVDETTICLTSPLLNKTEDLNMSENIHSIEVHQGNSNSKTNVKYSIEYILEQIEKIAAQTDYLKSAFETLGQMSDGENPEAYSPGNLAGQAKAHAIRDAVNSRETTNQQLLKLYEKMYEDLRPKEPTTQDKAMDIVTRALNNDQLQFDDVDMLISFLDTVRHIGR